MLGWSARLQRTWSHRDWSSRLLLPAAWLYAAANAKRRWLHRLGWWRSVRLSVPVIVVGNLIVGGAGKTPTVLALVSMLRRQGYTPGIVSRGYGGSATGVVSVQPQTPVQLCGDEPLLLRLRADAPVFVGRDRVAAAQALLRAHPEVNLIISDDGLQHLRLARDVQVLVFDERGIGNGWLLPAGPLREKLPPQIPARSVVLYNAPAATTPWPGWCAERRLAGAVALESWWQGLAANPQSLEVLKGRTLIAAAGVAQPERFFTMLRAAGLTIAPLALTDHHDYATLPWPPSATDVIVTEKDAVKLDPARTAGTRIWVVALDFVPAAAFDAQVLSLLSHPASPATAHAHGNSIA